MSEEFETYGFNSWFMKLVGFLKLSMAVLLIAGIWYSNLVEYAAFVIGTLMVGAIFAHVKINDPFIKSVPALIMLILVFHTNHIVTHNLYIQINIILL